MNILIMVTQLNKSNGGVCTHIVDLCRGFVEEGHKVYVASEVGDYTEKVKDTGAKFYEVSFYTGRSILSFRNTWKQIETIIKKDKIDIMHLHGQRIIPVASMVKRKTKVPYLWTNHIDAIAQPKLFKIMLKVFKFPIISVSTDLKEFMMKEFHIKKNRIRVICNGVSMEDFPPLSEEEKEQLRQEYKIKPNQYVIALLARVAPVKGHDLLLRVVHKVQEKYPDLMIKVLFAGKRYGWDQWYEELFDYADEKRMDVSFIGFQKPRDVFGVADISVLPSSLEGFGITCIESFCMKCPVIRSNSPGWSDMKDISLVFPKGDEEKFAKELEYAITHQDAMKALGIDGYEKTKNEFTKRTMCKKTLDFYQKVLQKKG